VELVRSQANAGPVRISENFAPWPYPIATFGPTGCAKWHKRALAPTRGHRFAASHQRERHSVSDAEGCDGVGRSA